jgi:hypothetical protein
MGKPRRGSNMLIIVMPNIPEPRRGSIVVEEDSAQHDLIDKKRAVPKNSSFFAL